MQATLSRWWRSARKVLHFLSILLLFDILGGAAAFVCSQCGLYCSERGRKFFAGLLEWFDHQAMRDGDES